MIPQQSPCRVEIWTAGPASFIFAVNCTLCVVIVYLYIFTYNVCCNGYSDGWYNDLAEACDFGVNSLLLRGNMWLGLWCFSSWWGTARLLPPRTVLARQLCQGWFSWLCSYRIHSNPRNLSRGFECLSIVRVCAISSSHPSDLAPPSMLPQPSAIHNSRSKLYMSEAIRINWGCGVSWSSDWDIYDPIHLGPIFFCQLEQVEMLI